MRAVERYRKEKGMKKKISIALIVLGIAFLLWAVFGRYIVLPGYFESLASGASQSGSIPENVPAWKIARYLIWAFSFKLGIYLITLGALLKAKMSSIRFALFAVAGLIYISVAYMPLTGPSWLFGAFGILMTVFMVMVILRLSQQRDQVIKNSESATDLRLVSYFFFAMTTYTLCGLLGVRTSALDPERMIEFGLQADAVSFAAHALIELALGWLFVLLSISKQTSSEANLTARS